MRALVVLLAFVLVGCATPSTMLVNDQGHVMRCAAHGQGAYGIASAGNIHAACVADLQKVGYAPIPSARLGVRNRGNTNEISEVPPGSPLHRGDMLLRIDDKPAVRLTEVLRALHGKQPGDQVLVTVARDGQEVSMPVTLRAWNE